MIFQINKSILVFFRILAMVTGYVKGSNTYSLADHISFLYRAEDYIKLIRTQHSNTLEDMNTKMQQFTERYLGRLEVIKLRKEISSASRVEIEDYLNPLEFLNDLSKKCVTKYRGKYSKVVSLETSIQHCVLDVSSQIKTILDSSLKIKNSLEDHYKNYFDKEITICDNKFANTIANYSSCIRKATSEAHNFSIETQKNFEMELEVAECKAKVNIMRAVDCSYGIQKIIIAQTAKANMLIDKCLKGKDECQPCDGFICPHSLDWKIDNKNLTIFNPLHMEGPHSDCLLLKLNQNKQTGVINTKHKKQ